MIADIDKKNNPVSPYQPSGEELEFIKIMKRDYAEGIRILIEPTVELNNKSVIEDENRGLRMFNAYVEDGIDDPSQSWKWPGTMSKARKKGIAMLANLTGNYLLPMFVAQNDKDEVDKNFSELMRDLIEWMAQPTVSSYQMSFLQVVISMITSPVVYMGVEWCEIYQTIKERQKDGSIKKKEVLDQILSGFQSPVYGPTEILITNDSQRNIQRQRAIIKRNYYEYEELKAKYKDNPNWIFVKAGIKSIYNDKDGLFYDIKDEEHPSLVAEEVWFNRQEDAEIPVVNGIYMGKGGVDDNPIKHRDNHGMPKYNVVPFGFSRIGHKYFYYKSMMNALGWENAMYDEMSRMIMNRSILDIEMPIAISGSDQVDSDVIFPNAVVSFEDKDTKISPLLPNSNLQSGVNAIQMLDESIEEGTVSDTLTGNLPEASQKAYNVAQAQANAKKMIGVVGKSLAESIVQYGSLMKDIVINHLTIPQIDELAGDNMRLKYKTFFLGDKASQQMADKIIKFDESLIGKQMSLQEQRYEGLKELERITKKTGKKYNEIKEHIFRVNPELFAKFNYLCKVDVQEMFTKNQEYWQPILTQLEAQLRNNPLVNQEELLRRMFYSYFQSDGEDLINKQQPQLTMPEVKGRSNMAGMLNNQSTANAVEKKVIS